MSENILYYHSDPEDQSVLKMIPQKENRINLVKEAHVFGLFGFDKTFKELSEKNYWKNMGRDCDFVIKSCLPCLRFKKTPILDHPALSLPITQILDRIGIDLSFWPTKNGKRICWSYGNYRILNEISLCCSN